MYTHTHTKQANFKPVGEKNVLLRKSSGLEGNFKEELLGELGVRQPGLTLTLRSWEFLSLF